MRVDIVPMGDVPDDDVSEASHALEAIYDCETEIRDSVEYPGEAYDRPRDQYEAGKLLDESEKYADADKVLCISDHDLFYRRRNYVFGLAYLNGKSSLISTHRLRIVPDGGVTAQSEEDVATSRIRKEAVHEIGHTLGLEHCDNSRCVMNFSPTVREVDIKEETLCGSCSREVR